MLNNPTLEALAPVLMTFGIKRTGGVNDLKDDNIGEPVMLTGNLEVGRICEGGQLLGKLICLTLTDEDDRDRIATVQIGGICRLALSKSVSYPAIGARLIGGEGGTVRAATLIVTDGVYEGRGTVLGIYDPATMKPMVIVLLN